MAAFNNRWGGWGRTLRAFIYCPLGCSVVGDYRSPEGSFKLFQFWVHERESKTAEKEFVNTSVNLLSSLTYIQITGLMHLRPRMGAAIIV